MANNTEASVQVPTLADLVTPVLTGEWVRWDDEQAEAFSAQVHTAVEVVGLLRQRHDEQLDSAHALGKFSNVKRVRKARTTEDEGPKVDPLAAALGKFAA